MAKNNAILNNWSLVMFGAEHGNAYVAPMKNKTTGEEYTSVVFDNGATKTFVSISENLGDIDEDYLVNNYEDLQVIELQPDPEVIKARKAKKARGEAVQMESYMLCMRGEGTWKRVALDFKALAGMK